MLNSLEEGVTAEGGSGLRLPPPGGTDAGDVPERCLLLDECWCRPDRREVCPNMRRKRDRERIASDRLGGDVIATPGRSLNGKIVLEFTLADPPRRVVASLASICSIVERGDAA